jgi:peptide/nickel transport system substrate-binding protein
LVIPHRRALLSLAIVAAVGVCASDCARRNNKAPEPVVMRIGIGLPLQGSPASGARSVINSLISEPWFTNRPDGRQSERIATGWTWDHSATLLRLKLRRNVYFHDGTLLTPELAAEALRKSVKNASVEALSFSSIASVTPSGDDTLDIRLSEPNAFVLPDLSLVTVRRADHPDIGTGSFMIVRRDEQHAVLKAFPRYYRGRPAVDEIDVTNYPTQRSAWAALMRGDVDMLHEVSRDAAEFVEAETTVRTYSFPRPYYIPLVFNVRHPVLKNPEVRKAINEALDKAALIRDGLHGRGRPADGPVWPEHWAYSAPPQPFVFNPAAARLRLDRAGLPARPGPNGGLPIRFSFTCLAFAEDARFERLAVLVQKQLADVGIEMKLLPLNQTEMEKRLGRGDFDAFLFEMFGRSLSYAYEFWHHHEGARADTGYRAADAVLDRMRAATSDDQMRTGVADLARVLHQDPPAAFIAWQTTSRAVSTKFDVSAEPNRDILSNVWQWHLAGAPGLVSR